MKTYALMLLYPCALFLCSCALSSKSLKVADFDSKRPFNLLGGNFGCWDKSAIDKTQWAKDEFSKTDFFGENDYSVKIKYDVNSPNPAYNGFWMKLQNLDVLDYNYLVFWVKGSEEDGFTDVFGIELKSASQTGKSFARGITNDWKEVKVPLKEFYGLNDFQNLTEFVIVFSDGVVSQKEGAIFIDEISFEK